MKRGQVSMFVIIAIVIVIAIVFLFVYPNVNVISSDAGPNNYLSDCLRPELDKTLETLEAQGGYINPSNSIKYKDIDIQYLCYTSENYKPCVVQQPLLVNHVGEEIEKAIDSKARECVDQLREVYQRKGFQTKIGYTGTNVTLSLGKIIVDINAQMSLTKETTETYQRFSLTRDSKLYELLMFATNIVQFESTLGDSETTLYMRYYPNLRIDKVRVNSDTIYILTDVVSEESFTFASRSLVWPSGYTGK